MRHKPYTVNLPHFMTCLRPWDDFAFGVVKVITNDGTSLSFMGLSYENRFKSPEVVCTLGLHSLYPRMVVCLARGI